MSLATLFRYKSLDAIPGRSRTVITVSSLLVLTLGILSSVFLVRLLWRGASVQAAQTGLTVVSAASFSETALAPESLADLSWTDPALGVSDAAWLPEVRMAGISSVIPKRP